MAKMFGEFFGELRRKNTGLSLREFCERFGFDPGNVSKMERGKLPPPPQERLGAYAQALGLEVGSDDWYEFADCAAIARRELPGYVAADEELVDLMPVLFRAWREGRETGEPISEERLRTLLHILRTA
jgi:transcriptional regulator with XRE-family HTH domain